MNAWDVVVHASVRPEPFGRVILEGMLLGKPVVATAAGGVPELIDDGRDRLSRAARRRRGAGRAPAPLLAAPRTARGVGARARDWARERFALDRHVAEMSADLRPTQRGVT